MFYSGIPLASQIQPIAYIRTPYSQKFAIPRQPGLVKAAKGIIQFTSDFNDANCLRGIEQFSHLWLIFQFHQNQGWSPLVRPPRLGGNKKQGVFATRSSFRPNGLGMSVVTLEKCQKIGSATELVVNGVDLLDNTPIFDIKPYIAYADSIPHANAGFAERAPEPILDVLLSAEAQQQLSEYSAPTLQTLLVEVLQQDPRPAYKRQAADEKVYAVQLWDYDIQFKIVGTQCLVVNISQQK